jgi:hypothetical protein
LDLVLLDFALLDLWVEVFFAELGVVLAGSNPASNTTDKHAPTALLTRLKQTPQTV